MLRAIQWQEAWRIIASRYPPIQLFESLTDDPAVWAALITLEELTNPRVRDEVGQLALVPPDERIAGPGASFVMAAFTHLNPKGSRFSNGSYGVYYAAADLQTALCETIHHFEKFARDAADPHREEDMRVLLGTAHAEFHDLAKLEEVERAKILDPDNYAASQIFAMSLRNQGSNGIVYPSVRNAGGTCIAAFRPKAVGIPLQERHVRYRWNGHRVDRYFDFSKDQWIDIPTAR
jgi:hypothetical protein